MTDISYSDAGIIIVITVVAVGGVKLGYALMATRARLLVSAAAQQKINMLVGSLMIAIGLFLITKAGYQT